MLCAMLAYTRNGAFIVTAWPFWYSSVGRRTEPSGPVPLIPNGLLSWGASMLCPQPDSSIACAIVTEAGIPYCRCAASAPGATWAINACRAAESGTDAVLGAAWLRLYRAPDPAWPCRAREACWPCRALDATEE